MLFLTVDYADTDRGQGGTEFILEVQIQGMEKQHVYHRHNDLYCLHYLLRNL